MYNLFHRATLVAIFSAVSMMPAMHAQVFDAFDPQANVKVFHTSVGGESFLGVNLQEIDGQRAKDLKLKEEAGVEITRVESDSPAEKAGLKVGDVVLEYNGQRVEGMAEFSRLVHETPPGREVKLLISRNGTMQTVTAKIGQRKAQSFTMNMPRMEFPPMPPMPDMPKNAFVWPSSTIGIEGEALRGQLADYFGVHEGVLVRSVLKGTPAEHAGLKAGDVIVKMGDRTVAEPGDIRAAIMSAKNKKAIPVTVLRDHKEVSLTVAVDDDDTGRHFFRTPMWVNANPVRM